MQLKQFISAFLRVVAADVLTAIPSDVRKVRSEIAVSPGEDLVVVYVAGTLWSAAVELTIVDDKRTCAPSLRANVVARFNAVGSERIAQTFVCTYDTDTEKLVAQVLAFLVES